jgi:hypothetical protein
VATAFFGIHSHRQEGLAMRRGYFATIEFSLIDGIHCGSFGEIVSLLLTFLGD